MLLAVRFMRVAYRHAYAVYTDILGDGAPIELARAIARVDHLNPDPGGQEIGGVGIRMAKHQEVQAHRFQIPGQAHLRLGYKNDGIGAHWRGIFDDKGRIMVAISFNSDVGDAWEYADDPDYPEKFADLAIRIGVNYVVYAMTH